MPGPWCNVVVAIPSRLVLYTDGLVENPRLDGDPDRWSDGGLVAWLDAHPEPDPEALVDALVAAALAERERRDDVAVMVVDAVPT